MSLGRLYLILWLTILTGPPLLAGEPRTPEEADSMRLIALSDNRIKGNAEVLDKLFARLERLAGEGEEVVSILHLGDSHIQAGFLTNVVRQRLQQEFGNAGRGLIVPLHLMHTNEPEGYRIDSPNAWTGSRCAIWNVPFAVGIGGVAIATLDPVVEFTLQAPEDPFNRITVFHHSEAPFLSPDTVFSTDIFCPADDTEYSTCINLNRSVECVTLRGDISHEGFTTPVFYGFSLENGRSGVLYHSAGVNGNAFEYLNRSPAIVELSPLLNPDLIVVSLGTNDAIGTNFNADRLYAQVDRLLGQLRRVNPDAAMLLVTPMEFCSRSRVRGVIRYTPNKNVEAVRNVIIRAARAHELPYWDLYDVARGGGAMERWHKAGLTYIDRVHLLREGYVLQGELFYRALSDAYRAYLGR